MKPSILVIGLILGLGLGNAAVAASYKWKDASGKAHYGSLPPGGGVAYQEIDGNGRVIRSVDSFEEQKRKQLEEQQKAKAQEDKKERQRKDNALLSTYANVNELDQMHERTMAIEKAQLESIELQLKQAEQNQQGLKTKIAAEKTPNAVLKQQAEEADTIVKLLKSRLARQRESLMASQARFEADRARFVELKGGANQ